MTYDYRAKKVMAVLAENLACPIALNVLGHMALAMGTQRVNGLMGRSGLLDALGVWHAGISRYPLVVAKTTTGKLRQLIAHARQQPAISMVDFPEQMLLTGHDDELAASIASVKENEIIYLGALLYGDTITINGLTGKFSLWR